MARRPMRPDERERGPERELVEELEQDAAEPKEKRERELDEERLDEANE